MPSITSPHRRTESTARGGPADPDYRGEQLTIRNHDDGTGYGLTLGVTDDDGRVLVRTSYFVGAGTTKRVFDLCEPGEVTVEARHAGRSAGSVTTHVDDSPERTVVIECGDGAVTTRAGHP